MRVLYITAALVVLDQVTKLLVKGFTVPILGWYHEGMYLGQSIPVIGDFLRLTFIENPGMAFGIEIGGRLFITLFSVIASIGIGYYLYRIRNEAFVVRLSLALILAGALGNLIDRIFYGVIFGEAPLFYGKVVDFVDVDFFNINLLGVHMSRWAVFNVADSCVSIGVVLMLLFHKKFTHDVEGSSSVPKPEVAAAGDSTSSDPKP
ncbi:MAG: signal peptidase II [Bacteroidetes bacterium]|nr:signal peptidase II [Bacteroidota bacterium]